MLFKRSMAFIPELSPRTIRTLEVFISQKKRFFAPQIELLPQKNHGGEVDR